MTVMDPASNVVVLGPQRLQPTLADALDRVLALDGCTPERRQIAVVTAGWEEREEEVDELRQHVDRPVVDLRLFRRAEQVLRADAPLLAAQRQRTDRLRRLRELYRVRLSHALQAARELMRRTDSEAMADHQGLLEVEIDAAIEVVRDIDAHHFERVRELHAEHEHELRPGERDEVARHRAELARIVEDSCAVCFAGGNVAVLLDRLRLFDVAALVRGRPIVCWSAGSMALSEQVVLFHDSPPQGAGDAEVFEIGLGLFRGVLPLPHARRRLRLQDPTRVGIFARRFRPLVCAAMDERTRLHWDGARWRAAAGTRRLCEDGSLAQIDGEGGGAGDGEAAA